MKKYLLSIILCLFFAMPVLGNANLKSTAIEISEEKIDSAEILKSPDDLYNNLNELSQINNGLSEISVNIEKTKHPTNFKENLNDMKDNLIKNILQILKDNIVLFIILIVLVVFYKIKTGGAKIFDYSDKTNKEDKKK